jgi:predicted nucleic acid-binding protein
MNVVSDASPLIALIRIGQLDLLCQLYSEIIIPEAVWHEVVVEGADQPGAEVVSFAS